MSPEDASHTGRDLVLRSLREIQRLRRERDAERAARREPLAIVGLGCRFPAGANSPDEFWEKLRGGYDAVADMGDRRWSMASVFDPDPAAVGKMYAHRAALLDSIDGFDAAFFGLSPAEADAMDPQQRLLLEVAWEAIQSAGYAPRSLAGAAAGVFVSLMSVEYAHLAPEITGHLGAGNAMSVAAGRLSYLLDLHGPSVALDTACSGSAVAVHLACQSLRAGECDLALAGGANLIISPETSIAECKALMLSPKGACRTFDAGADGYVRGEGCGVVVLKRLSDARRDGDTIHAVILGTAVNHDGATQGLTAPSGAAQARVIRAALNNAGVASHSVSYVEAHGTGTELGDPIECAALDQVYGADRDPADRLDVGSVKTNIGHTEAAAGVAGLIKTVLMLRNQEIAPHLHLTKLNPHIRWGDAFQVPTRGRPWTAVSGPRRAGLSSFGFSGTNVHMILEEGDRSSAAAAPLGRSLVLPISALTETALCELIDRYIERLERTEASELADLCYTAAVGRDHSRFRTAVVGSTPAAMAAQLKQLDLTIEQVARGARAPRGVVFARDGADAQAAIAAFRDEPTFEAAFAQARRVVLSETTPGLKPTWASAFAGVYAACMTLQAWGVRPSAWLGEGAVGAAMLCASGAMSLEDAVARGATAGFDIRLGGADPETLPRDSLDEAVRRLGEGQTEVVIDLGGRDSIAIGKLDLLIEAARSAPGGASSGRACTSWQAVLAALYVRGGSFDWPRIWSGYDTRRVPVPTQPFERQRHWFSGDQRRTSRVNGSAVVHGQDGRVYVERTLPRPATVEHKVFGVEIAPAALWLALVAEAAGEVCDANTLALHDIAFLKPMYRTAPLRVQILLEPTGATSATFWLASRNAVRAEAPWVRHATGRIDWSAAATTFSRSHQMLQADHTHNAAPPPDAYYGLLRERGLELGPGFTLLGDGYRNADLYVRRLKQAESAATRLDPQVVDAAFHVVASCFDASEVDAEPQLWLPTRIDRLLIASAGARRIHTVQGAVRAAETTPDETTMDLQLFGPGDDVSLEISGLRLQPVSAPQFAGDEAPVRGHLMHHVRWRVRPIAQPDPDVSSGRHALVMGSGAFAAQVRDTLMAQGWTGVNAGRSDLATGDASGDLAAARRLLEGASMDGRVLDIVWLLDEPHSAVNPPLADLGHSHRLSCGSLLRFAQILADVAPLRARLEVVLRGDWPGAHEGPGLEHAPAWGLARTVALELPPGVRSLRLALGSGSPTQQVARLVAELRADTVETEVAYLGDTRHVRRLAATTAQLAPPTFQSGSYLVTGASGGVGREICRWLVARGARRLALASRSGAADLRDELLALMGPQGEVLDLKCDVAEAAAVDAAIACIRHHMAPLKGVVHAAGDLEDALLPNQNEGGLQRVLRPKAAGAWNLHRSTLDDDLEVFVLVSSASAVFGAPGQANYAAANAFLDALAAHRRALGLPALSIAWGPWRDTGMNRAAHGRASSWAANLGVKPLEPAQALKALGVALASGQTSMVVLDCDWTAPGPPPIGPFLSELQTASTPPPQLLATLRAAPVERWPDLLIRRCRDLLEPILDRVIDGDACAVSLLELGVDSMSALRLRHGLYEELAIDLPITHLLTELSLTTLVSQIVEQLSAGDPEGVAPEPRARLGRDLVEIIL